MAEGMQGRRCRSGSDWTVQPLEGRLMPSGLGVPTTGVHPADVASPNVLQPTATNLRASIESNANRPTVDLIATVVAPQIKRPVGAGRVRFTIVSPTHQLLGVTHPNAHGTAELKTKQLVRGETYVVQASFIAPNAHFAPSSARLEVTVGASSAASLRITAPQYYGAPGTPVAFIVTALDRTGHRVPDYTGTVQFVSPTDHSAKFGTKTYTFTAADQGAHAFPDGVTFHKGGAEVVKVRQVNNSRISGTQVFGIE